MLSVLGTVFGVSLAGSLHCAGMCGPFVGLAAGGDARLNGRPLARLCAYHGARLLAYAALGALAGLLGAALNLGGALLGWQRVAAVGAGLTIALIGLGTVLGSVLPLALPLPRAAWLTRLTSAGFRAAAAIPPTPRAALLGGLTALLPCGWLYVFLAAAAGAGSPGMGALVMAAFWAGTVPILFAVGVGVQQLHQRAGGGVRVGMGVVLMGLGVWMSTQRALLDVSALQHHAVAQTAGVTVAEADHLREVDVHALPCCQHGG